MKHPAPSFVLNSNGDTHDRIKRYYMEAHEVAVVLRSRLHEINAHALHGRNYQTTDGNGQDDRETMYAILENLKAIEEYLISGAARVIRQREGI